MEPVDEFVSSEDKSKSQEPSKDSEQFDQQRELFRNSPVFQEYGDLKKISSWQVLHEFSLSFYIPPI